MSFDFLSPNSLDPKSFISIDPNVEGVTLSQYPLSISVWFKSVNAGIAIQPGLVCLTVAGVDEQIRIDINQSIRRVRMGVSTVGGTTNTANTTTYTDDVWTHGCAVFTSATSRTIYANGANPISSATSRVFTDTTISTIEIGYNIVDDVWAAHGTKFLIAEVGIWNIALSADDVLSLAKGNIPLRVRPESLVKYFPLTGTSVEVITGATGASHTVTPTAIGNDHPIRFG